MNTTTQDNYFSILNGPPHYEQKFHNGRSIFLWQLSDGRWWTIDPQGQPLPWNGASNTANFAVNNGIPLQHNLPLLNPGPELGQDINRLNSNARPLATPNIGHAPPKPRIVHRKPKTDIPAHLSDSDQDLARDPMELIASYTSKKPGPKPSSSRSKQPALGVASRTAPSRKKVPTAPKSKSAAAELEQADSDSDNDILMGGRRRGAMNYKYRELEILVDVVEEIGDIGGLDWPRIYAEYLKRISAEEEGFPERNLTAIRRQWKKLCKVADGKPPTGNPKMADLYVRAQQIEDKFHNDVGARFCNDRTAPLAEPRHTTKRSDNGDSDSHLPQRREPRPVTRTLSDNSIEILDEPPSHFQPKIKQEETPVKIEPGTSSKPSVRTSTSAPSIAGKGRASGAQELRNAIVGMADPAARDQRDQRKFENAHFLQETSYLREDLSRTRDKLEAEREVNQQLRLENFKLEQKAESLKRQLEDVEHRGRSQSSKRHRYRRSPSQSSNRSSRFYRHHSRSRSHHSRRHQTRSYSSSSSIEVLSHAPSASIPWSPSPCLQLQPLQSPAVDVRAHTQPENLARSSDALHHPAKAFDSRSDYISLKQHSESQAPAPGPSRSAGTTVIGSRAPNTPHSSIDITLPPLRQVSDGNGHAIQEQMAPQMASSSSSHSELPSFSALFKQYG